jgi:hypothetical protein
MNIDELRLKQAEFEANRIDFDKEYRKNDKTRIDFVSKFPLDKIKDMSLDDYVVGKGSKKSFCYILENALKSLGDIHGSTSFKFGLYYGAENKSKIMKYRFTNNFGNNLQEVFENIKLSIISLIKAGESGDIESVRENLISPMLKGKILATYFPDKYLSIFSNRHLDHYLDKLKVNYSKRDDELAKREYLLHFKNNDIVMRGWSNYDFARFLYLKIGKPVPIKSIFSKELQEYADIDFPDVEDVDYKFIDRNLADMEENNLAKIDRAVMPKKIDFDRENRINGKTGAQGELIVLRAEKEHLNKLGLTVLASQVIHKSKESDSFGYDILSFDDSGKEKFIEVKSTKGKSTRSHINFLITANEFKQAGDRENYYIYIVFEAHTKKPEILKLKKPFDLPENKVKIVPDKYKVSIGLLSE